MIEMVTDAAGQVQGYLLPLAAVGLTTGAGLLVLRKGWIMLMNGIR